MERDTATTITDDRLEALYARLDKLTVKLTNVGILLAGIREDIDKARKSADVLAEYLRENG